MEDVSDIREHMEVIGSDGKHVGTVDHLDGARIKLTKSDPAASGKHHYLEASQIQTVKNGKVCLNLPAARAFQVWMEE